MRPSHPALWQLLAHGHEAYLPGERYWWDNASRRDAFAWVVQAIPKGEVIYRHRGQPVRRVAAGQVFVFRHGEPSVYGQPDPLQRELTCEWVQLRGAGLDEHLQSLRHRHGPVLRPRHLGSLLDAMNRLVDLGSTRSQAPATRIAEAAYALVTTLHDIALDDSHRPPSRVDLAVHDLLTFPCRSRTLDQVAQQFRVSREHLSRHFRKTTGQTVRQHLGDARTLRALTLLRQTGLPLSDIAQQAGLDHPHRLAQYVLRHTGLSPNAYRRQHQPAVRDHGPGA